MVIPHITSFYATCQKALVYTTQAISSMYNQRRMNVHVRTELTVDFKWEIRGIVFYVFYILIIKANCCQKYTALRAMTASYTQWRCCIKCTDQIFVSQNLTGIKINAILSPTNNKLLLYTSSHLSLCISWHLFLVYKKIAKYQKIDAGAPGN